MTPKPGALTGFLVVLGTALLCTRAIALPVLLKSGAFDPARSSVHLQSTPTDSYYLVQFSSAPGAAERQALEEADATILGYIPENCYLVQAQPQAMLAAGQIPGVVWTGPYASAYRIAPSVPNTDAPVHISVTTFPGVSVKKLIAQMGLSRESLIALSASDSGDIFSVKATGAQAHAWTRLAGVRWIQPRIQPKLANDIARGIMNVNPVWTDVGLYGQGQTVAVCDTGLDVGATSPSLDIDFQGRVSAAFALGRTGLTDDPHGHGTHVSGSVLGNGKLSGSDPSTHSYLNSYAGVAPEANLIMQSVLDANGNLGGLPANLATLFTQAYQAGARVHTNSWGATVAGVYDTDASQVDQFVWSHPDAVVLFAAGNDGVDADSNGVIDPQSVGSPGTAKNCITVGATESVRSSGGYQFQWGTGSWASNYPAPPIKNDLISDNSFGMAAFSSRGPCEDGRIKPDICAPGTNILSVRSHNPAAGTGWGPYNADYVYMGGTSMATPLAAGATALLRQYFQQVKGIDPSAALIKATLLVSARDLTPGQYGAGSSLEIPARPNNVEGWGRVDLQAAVNPAPPNTLQLEDYKAGLQTGEIRSFSFRIVTAGVPLRIALAWTDYPGDVSASKALVNDLDLQVHAPSGQVFAGNGTSDHANNVESVDIASPEIGTYTVTVSGYSVPHGPQPFALVAQGGLPNAALSGHITSTSGTPIPNAAITATSLSAVFTASSRPDGSYDIAVIPDDYSVEVSKNGWSFNPVSHSVTVPAEGAGNVDFVGTASPASISGSVFGAQTQQGSGTWQSVHPYLNNTNDSVTISGPANAVRMRVHFAQMATESGYDFVTISDSDGGSATSYSGNNNDFWSPWIDGNAVRVNLSSDVSVTRYGWLIDAFQATIPGSPMTGVTVTDSLSGISSVSGLDGSYVFPSVQPLPTTLSASIAEHVIKPSQRDIAPTPGQSVQGQDFVAIPEVPVIHVKLTHSYPGDLVIKTGVGTVANPVLIRTIWNRQTASNPTLTLDIPVDEGNPYFPPSAAHPWFLQICDQSAYDQGTLLEFSISRNGRTYGSFQTPAAINDLTCVTVSVPSQTPIRIGDAKQIANNTSCLLMDKVVTAVFADRIYVQESDRSSAICVPGVFGVTAGDCVSVLGAVDLMGCERIVNAAQVQKTAQGSWPVRPLFIGGRNVGGEPLSPVTPGFADSIDLNNIGLLVTVSGTVRKTDAGWFYVDDGTAAPDGSGYGGIRVAADVLQIPQTGAFVTVTGISNCRDSGFGAARIIYPRSQEDIVVLHDAPSPQP